MSARWADADSSSDEEGGNGFVKPKAAAPASRAPLNGEVVVSASSAAKKVSLMNHYQSFVSSCAYNQQPMAQS
jgi:hypothetical protein